MATFGVRFAIAGRD